MADSTIIVADGTVVVDSTRIVSACGFDRDGRITRLAVVDSSEAYAAGKVVGGAVGWFLGRMKLETSTGRAIGKERTFLFTQGCETAWHKNQA